MIYYVGNFRGYSLQLELLDWTPLADTATPFFSARSCESQPHFHTQPCTFLHNVYFLLAKIKHALVKVFILKYRKIKTKHSSTEKIPKCIIFSSSCAHKKNVTNCTTFWNKISNGKENTQAHADTIFHVIIETHQENPHFSSNLNSCLDVFGFYCIHTTSKTARTTPYL